jgi:hypothetical protein
MSGIICPSYKAGFASPQRGRIKHRSLWRGCVGAWGTSLGPSGSTIFDQSGYGQHCTFNNMEPDTDWEINGGAYSLRFGGTNEYAEASLVNNPISGLSQCTLSGWMSRTSATSVVFGYANNISNTSRISMLWFTDGVLYCTVNNSADMYPNASLGSTGTFHLAITFDGNQATNITKLSLYVNGKLTALANAGALGPSVTASASNLNRFWIGRDLTRYTTGYVGDVMAHSRMLTQKEISLLATRPGIAYETTQRRSYKAAAPPAATANNLMLLGVG